MVINILTQLSISIYTLVLIGLAGYALHVGMLAIMASLTHSKALQFTYQSQKSWPDITIQVPLRNERYMVKRILKHVSTLDYPANRLHIQILDDSDDDTVTILEDHVSRLQRIGLDILVIHRDHPYGYKAGALANAFPNVTSDYIALFDADFMPKSDFLKQLVPYLVENPEVGMVQACWTHSNSNQNILTHVQALGLDAHFHVDHPARNNAGLLMNFNGSAGIWRKQAVIDSGGWSVDTLTEDLDLSYRTQIAGWHMVYVSDVTVAAELPPLLSEIRSQQRRWAKGAAQCMSKLTRQIVLSSRLTMMQKLFSVIHLSGYFAQLLMLLLLILSLPLTLLPPIRQSGSAWLNGLGILAGILPFIYYLMGQVLQPKQRIKHIVGNILSYPVLMFIGLSTSLDMSIALVDGIRHRGGVFVRTAKYAQSHLSAGNRYYRDQTGYTSHWTDILLLVYSAICIVMAIISNHYQYMHISVLYTLAVFLTHTIDAITRFRFRKQQKTG